MSNVERHLHVVPMRRTEGDAGSSDLDDLGITVMIFLISAFPLASALAGVGQWDEGSLGAGTLGVLLAGRELCAWLLARRRSKRRT